MPKTIEQLQAALDREIAYTMKLNEKITVLKEQLKTSISKEEHGRIVEQIRREYESMMSKINNSHSQTHNARNAGRKKKATDEVITRVMELHNQGLPQAAIAKAVSNERKVSVSRTLVGDIIRTQHSFSIR